MAIIRTNHANECATIGPGSDERGAALPSPAAAQNYARGIDPQLTGNIEFAWSQFDRTAKAIAAELPARNFVDRGLNPSGIVAAGWSEVDDVRYVGYFAIGTRVSAIGKIGDAVAPLVG